MIVNIRAEARQEKKAEGGGPANQSRIFRFNFEQNFVNICNLYVRFIV